MNYLINLGISEETLNKIIEVNGNAIILSIECNEESITNIINYLKYIGIKNIEDLLIYEIDFFLNDFEEIKKKLRRENVMDIYNINMDFTYIEKIEF